MMDFRDFLFFSLSLSFSNRGNHKRKVIASSTMSSSSLTSLRPEVQELKETLVTFVEKCCIPAEELYDNHMATRTGADRWSIEAIPPIIEDLKLEARRLGLWNLFLPRDHPLPEYIPADISLGLSTAKNTNLAILSTNCLLILGHLRRSVYSIRS